MSNQNAHKAGYKHTPLGWIPEEWEAVRIEDVAKLNPPRTILSDEDEVSFLGMADVSEEGKIVNSFIRKYGDVKNGFTYFKDGDILVAKITPCFENGKGALARNLKNGIGFGSTEFHVIRSGQKVYPTFLFYHTRLYHFRGHGEQNMTGSAGQKRVPSDFIETYKISLPALPEQHKIATILSTWDEAITKTQQLIAQLQQRNKGLMQQLLTGKKRLKGFDGEWKNIPLESIIEEFREQSAGNNQYEVLTSSKRGIVKQRDYFGANRLSERDNDGFNVIPSGYITYRSRSDDGLFTFNINEFGFTGIISIYYPVFKIKEGSNRYIVSLLNFFNYKVGRYSVGTSQLVLSMNDLKSIHFDIPSPKEQFAIAECLEMALGEVKLTEQKLAALQQQKKGLVQKLLTGEVRVKI